MCNIIQVSSSGYYKWLNRPQSNRDKKTAELSVLIRQEYENSHQTYGSPRITQVLNMQHKKVSRSYVARLMKKMNLKSKVRRKYKITTDSNHVYQAADNLLQRNFSAAGLSQKWVSDITYIKTAYGWMYFTAVIDLADRKVIGWSFSNDMSAANTVVKALKAAIKNRGVKNVQVVHLHYHLF